MDLSGAVIGLFVLSPVLLFTALFILCVSPGPVFFRQKRAGCCGRPFVMWKFRTMPVDVDSSEHLSYVADLANNNGVLTLLRRCCGLAIQVLSR